MPKLNNKKSAASQQSHTARVLRAGASTAALSAALAVALLAAAAVLVSTIDVASALYEPITTAIAAVATLLASYLTGKNRKTDGLATGAASGTMVFGALALAGAIFTQRGITAQSLVKLLALTSAGGVGGIMGVSAKPRAKKLARGQ